MFQSICSRLAGVLCCLAVLVCPALSQQTPSPKIAPLLTQLKSAQPATRAAAAQKLEPFARDERVITAMLTACQDTDPSVRKNAAINLGVAADPRGVAPLCALLKDRNDNIRTAAIQALQYIGDEQALPALITLLQQDNTEDGRNIVQALAAIGGETAMQALLTLARDPDHAQRGDAIIALGSQHDARLTEIILPELQAATGNPSSFAVEAAGRIGDPRFVAPLLALLAKPQAGVDHNGIFSALGELGDARAVDALCLALKTGAKDGQDCEFAAQALGQIGDPRAIPALTAALTDTSAAMRSLRPTLITALGNMHDPTVITSLLPLLKEKDDTTHLAVLLALGNTRDVQAYDALAAELKGPQSPLYASALYALAQIPDPRAIPQVIAGLNAINSIRMQGWSLSDLGHALLRNPTATPERLLPALEVGALDDARNEIAEYLLRTKDPKVFQAVLGSLCHGPSLNIDPRVLGALKARQDETFTQLCALLTASKDMDKAKVVRLLGLLGDARALPLIQALKTDFWTQAAALQARGMLQDRTALPQLLDAAKNPQDDRLCEAAMLGLGALGEKSATEAVWKVYQLKPTAFNNDTRLAALVAAAQLGDPRALAPALALLRSDDYTTQQAALLALSYLPKDPRISTALAASLSKLQYFPLDPPTVFTAALTRYHTPELTRALLQQVAHADYQSGVAYQARVLIPILADTKETAAVPVLIGALYRQQADATARLAAVQALGQLGDPRAILPCLHALRDNNPAVIAAAAAAAALKHLTGQDLGADHAKWVAWWLKQFAG